MLAGLLFPKEPLKRFPLAVFLSPLPIDFILLSGKNKLLILIDHVMIANNLVLTSTRDLDR